MEMIPVRIKRYANPLLHGKCSLDDFPEKIETKNVKARFPRNVFSEQQSLSVAQINERNIIVYIIMNDRAILLTVECLLNSYLL